MEGVDGNGNGNGNGVGQAGAIGSMHSVLGVL